MVSETIEQSSMSQFKIALCEIYNKDLHGLTENSSRDIQEHILATYLFDLEEFYDVEGVNDILNMMQNEYSLHEDLSHDNIRNYKNIVTQPNYFTLDIVELHELEGQEIVATKKTHYIKMIQRRWRSILKERERILKARRTPRSLRERELTGKWPKHLRNWPTLKK